MYKRNPNYKLKGLRVEYNLKQTDLAKLLQIGETTYNRKENGITEFTETEIEIICDAFKKDPTEIFFNSGVAKTTTNVSGA